MWATNVKKNRPLTRKNKQFNNKVMSFIDV